MRQLKNKGLNSQDSKTNMISNHAAVRPALGHALPRSAVEGTNTHGRDFSRVPINSAESASSRTSRGQTCPFPPQRCPFGGACHTCPPRIQAKPVVGIQRNAAGNEKNSEPPPIVHEVLRSSGQPLDPDTRSFVESRLGYDFGHVRVHTDAKAAESARVVNALAYTVGRDIVFGARRYEPGTKAGRYLLAHEAAHVLQQGASKWAGGELTRGDDSSPGERNADAVAESALAERPVSTFPSFSPMIQRRAAPYIRKITVNLTPPQSADLEWQGTPPVDAPGNDSFTVSTGKGYSNPEDPPGTCKRSCCSDEMEQCASPWNKPSSIGSCCTYSGNSFWTGLPLDEHNGWLWWTPVQPYYSTRGIALHQHSEVTGRPISHGCVRMDEPNAKRIHDFSNGTKTNVTIEGLAAPVSCEPDRQCNPPQGSDGKKGASEQNSASSSPKSESTEGMPGHAEENM